MSSRSSCDHSTGGDHVCHHVSSNPSVHQTLEELDFDRGIWGAAVSGDFTAVESKLRKDSSVVNDCDRTGYRALHYASRNGHFDICKILIEHGADVNVCTSSTKATPLHRAAFMGHLDIVKLLLKHGAKVDSKDCDGKTALDKATEKRHSHIIKVLNGTT